MTKWPNDYAVVVVYTNSSINTLLGVYIQVLMPEALVRVTSRLLGVSVELAEQYLERPASLNPTQLGAPPEVISIDE